MLELLGVSGWKKPWTAEGKGLAEFKSLSCRWMQGRCATKQMGMRGWRDSSSSSAQSIAFNVLCSNKKTEFLVSCFPDFLVQDLFFCFSMLELDLSLWFELQKRELAMKEMLAIILF